MSPTFKYRAANADGKYKDGFIEAQNQADAISQLHTQGLVVVDITVQNQLKKISKTKFLYSFLALFFMVIIAVLIFAVSMNKQALQESNLFEKARKANKIESYREFLKRYPRGKFSRQCQELLDSTLEENDLFVKAKETNKIESYREFLKRYPKGEFSEECQELLNKRYKEAIEICADFIILHADSCIKICNGYSEGWSEAIEVGINFNKVLSQLHKKLDEKGIHDDLEKTKSKLTEFMKKLVEPPPKYVDIHKKIIELYGIYSQIYSLAVSPSGSLLSFNNSVNTLQSNLIKTKNELDVMLKD